MKICVIVSDFGAAANIGGNVETSVKSFAMPDDVAEFIKLRNGQWTTIQLGIDHDDDRPVQT